MSTAVPLGSRANVEEVLEDLVMIYERRFKTLPSWRPYDRHTRWTGNGGLLVYYDPLLRSKIDEAPDMLRASAVSMVP